MSGRTNGTRLEVRYALDTTVIDLCLPVFSRAHVRTTKAAVTMHTLPDPRGNIPSCIRISNGKLHLSVGLRPRRHRLLLVTD